ncbi:MAG: aspartyl protease family protein [Gemmatimonadetes bacterium]|nr:aspartyl protease family protein [Gemmatimonadota bacterium]
MAPYLTDCVLRHARLALLPMALLGGCMPVHSHGAAPGWRELHVRFIRDRIFALAETPSGDTVTLFLDTGANPSVVLDASASRLGMPIVRGQADAPPRASLPALATGSYLPPLPSSPDFVSSLIVTSPVGEAAMFAMDHADGMLGRGWFAGRSWRFDYGSARAFVIEGDSDPCGAPAHCIPMGFQVDSAGRRTFDFPRIRIGVFGDSLDLLLDLGASTLPTPAALAVLGGTAGIRGASFIKDSVFRKWQLAHPEWRVVEQADQVSRQAMIEVPQVNIAGLSLGPVWFVRRPDRALGEMMTAMMDRPIDGSLGGSALRYLDVTLDYPRGVAGFTRASPPAP